MEPTPPDTVDAMAERLAQAEARLDDVTRQRVLGRIHQALAEQERATQSARHRWRAMALALAAAVVVMGGVWAYRARFAAQLAVSRPVAQPTRAAAPGDEATLTPFLVSGADAERAAQLLQRGHARLQLRAGERVWAQLGQRARLQFVGPARVELRALARGAVALELDEGMLLGAYDHARGGLLSIRSPGAVTDIVGTVFLVQASAGRTRVAVAEGAVRVQRAGKQLPLARGQALAAEQDAPVEMSAADQAALREHASGFVPAPGEQGILGITGPRLRASVEGSWLGETPLWVRMPAGAHTIALTASDGSQRRVRASVRRDQETELVSADAEVAPANDAAANLGPARAMGAVERTPAPRVATPGAAELYREAEAAMRGSDLERASAALAQLVQLHPRARSVDLALYELAQLSLRAQDYGSARRWLAQLARHGARPALEEPVASLRCQSLGPDLGSADYARCVDELRARFPKSPPAPAADDEEK